MHGIDVAQEMGYRPPGEAAVFIDRAEGAVIPGTVAHDPEQQAASLAGRPDGTLFKALVGVGVGHIIWLKVDPALHLLIFSAGPDPSVSGFHPDWI